MISIWPRSISAERAVWAMAAAGPTRIGMVRPRRAASTAPDKAVASQGCATAVGTGGRLAHRARSASYLPVPGGCAGTHRLMRDLGAWRLLDFGPDDAIGTKGQLSPQ